MSLIANAGCYLVHTLRIPFACWWIVFISFLVHYELVCCKPQLHATDGQRQSKSISGNASACLKDTLWTLEDIPQSEPIENCNKNETSLFVPLNQSTNHLYSKDQLPNSGTEPHSLEAAVYGEYEYIPPSRYVVNLKHGAVIFLYHPCAPRPLIEAIRYVARSCTWKHIISAFPEALDKDYPLAIVAHDCVYRMSSVDGIAIKKWLQNHLPSSEAPSTVLGSYNNSLIHRSQMSNDLNIPICSTISHADIMNLLKQKVSENPPSLPSLPTKTPRSEEAAWAVGSLTFLLVGLVLAVCYTQLWKKGHSGESFETSRIWNDESSPGSVSVAAIIRKFPNSIKDKVKRMKFTKHSRDRRYHRVSTDEAMYSEEEL